MSWLFFLLAAATPQVTSPEDLAPFLDEWIETRMAEDHIPGVVFALVQDGSAVLVRTYGDADASAGRSLAANSLLRVGSVSKPVTATAALRLTERFEIGLHDDLRPLLRDLPIDPPLDRPLSLHHLLTHSAGFSESLFGQHVADPADVMDLSTYLKRRLPPRFIDPGEVIAYNDHHTTLAGYVIEKVSGRAFAEFAREQVFEPLGMRSSSFDQVHLPPSTLDRLAKAYRWHEGRFEPYERDYILTTPAAGLYTTAEDMAQYLIALLECDGRVLTPESCETQKRQQFTQHRKLPGRAYGLAEGSHRRLRILYKDGQATGFNARLLLVPERRIGMFVAHNVSILGPMGRFLPASRFTRTLSREVLNRLFPEEEEEETDGGLPTPMEGADARVQRYAGDFRNVVAARHTWEKFLVMMDDVHAEATDAGLDFGHGPYQEIEPGLFQWHEGGAGLRAFRLVGGEPTHLFIGSGAYERIPWWASSRTTNRLLPALAVAFLLLAGVSGLRRYRDRSDRPAWAGLIVAVSQLAFLFGFALVFSTTDVQRFFKGPTPGLTLVLVFPLVGLAGTAMLVAWRLRRGFRDRARAALDGLAVSISLLFLAWLHYWNLLGFRF